MIRFDVRHDCHFGMQFVKTAVVFVGLDSGVEIVADELWQSEQAELSPAEFTQVWDLVHQRGTSASPSPA